MTCHQEIFTELNADCAEFCPYDTYNNWLAVGTYQLDESTSQRHGKLYLYSLQQQQQLQQQLQQQQEEEQQQCTAPYLVQKAFLDLPGIFDLQWAVLPSCSPTPVMGVALADGTLRIVAAQQTNNNTNTASFPPCSSSKSTDAAPATPSWCLQESARCQAVESGMALSLAWNPHQQLETQHLAAISSSAGTVSIVQVRESALTQLAEWTGHDLEVWMAAWDNHQPHVLYSGADDCCFKAWDIRTPSSSSSSSNSGAALDASDEQVPLFCNRRSHSAGVCCISSHPRRQHCLATGSYDESARLWDTRMLQRPMETCQVATGGGVWRLKWHPRQDHLLLAACMYNGFAVLEATESFGSLQVIEEYKGHESIAYGADWFRGPRQQQRQQQQQQQQHGEASDAAAAAAQVTADADAAALDAGAHQERVTAAAAAAVAGEVKQSAGMSAVSSRDIVATCSFYDRRLHLWSPKSCY